MTKLLLLILFLTGSSYYLILEGYIPIDENYLNLYLKPEKYIGRYQSNQQQFYSEATLKTNSLPKLLQFDSDHTSYAALGKDTQLKITKDAPQDLPWPQKVLLFIKISTGTLIKERRIDRYQFEISKGNLLLYFKNARDFSHQLLLKSPFWSLHHDRSLEKAPPFRSYQHLNFFIAVINSELTFLSLRSGNLVLMSDGKYQHLQEGESYLIRPKSFDLYQGELAKQIVWGPSGTLIQQKASFLNELRSVDNPGVVSTTSSENLARLVSMIKNNKESIAQFEKDLACLEEKKQCQSPDCMRSSQGCQLASWSLFMQKGTPIGEQYTLQGLEAKKKILDFELTVLREKTNQLIDEATKLKDES